MTVDVIYQGLPLVKAANARAEGDGWFVELESPMPVGTKLDLVTPDGPRSGRVESVVEGMGSGMRVRVVGAKQAEPNAPMAEMKSAPVVEKAAEKEDDEDEDKKPSGGGGGRKGKRKKTVIGH